MPCKELLTAPDAHCLRACQVENQFFKGAILLLQLGKALLTLRDSLSWQLKRKGNLLQRNTAIFLPKDTAVLAKLSLKLRSKVI